MVIVKINKKEAINRKAGISYSEILILILSIFAFSYILSSGLEIAEAATQGCCTKTKDNVTCQDVSNEDECASSLFPAKCEQMADCKRGCCIDNRGLCSAGSPKSGCENGKWIDDANCNILECRKGCCILGDNTEFTTEKYCQYLSDFYGFPFDLRQNTNQLECLGLSKTQKIGACLIGDNACKFGEEVDCLKMNGKFKEGLLCTNPQLNTTCKKTENTICVEGKDEVYFKDSCGNIANIYDASKINNLDYWSKVIGKNESCNAGKDNIENKNCGNCDYLLGSKCKNNICQDLNCKDAPWIVENNGKILETKDRKNGESWCVYDDKVGNGSDVPGSRHWRYYCLDGQVKNEGCEDLRQEVCGKADIENLPEPSTVVEKAESVGCVANRWRECVQVTTDAYFGKTNDFKAIQDLFKKLSESPEARKEMKNKCEDIGQCDYYEMKLSKTPIVPVCKPKFPGGLNFWEMNISEKKDTADLTCNVATSIPYIGTCVKITLTGDCSGCVSGCDCGTEKWLKEANNICKSFGDCGANVNIAGDVSIDGYQSTIGKTNKTKPGKLLPQAYLDSLKDLVKEKTKENVDIVYKNISNGTGLGGLGKIATSGGGGWTGPFGLGSLANFGDAFQEATWWMPIFWGAWIVIEVLQIIGDVVGIIGKDCGVKKTYYHYTCLPYQAPKGGENCDYCNNAGNETKICSEYRCKSLGAACSLLNEGTGYEACTWLNKNDSTPPKISPWGEILVDASYEKETCSSQEGCYKLKGTQNGCIKPYTEYSLGIKADEPAQCKVDMNHTSSFDEMESWIDNNYYLKQHKTNISFISPGQVYESLGINISNKYDLYIRCSDANGNENKDEMKINLCVDAGEDKNEPRIVRTIPENNKYVSYNTTEIEAGFYINEPAQCKYSLQDKSYNLMENSMNCSTAILDAEPDLTFLCSEKFSLTGNSTKFYIRCKDQPWLTGANESRRNVNQESYVYELKKSNTELKINRIEPNGTITGGVEPFSVLLEVQTGGGAENGKADCSWNWLGTWLNFYETSSNIHTQELNLNKGSYDIPIKCEDVAGNIAEENAKFKLKIDKGAPKIIRIYNSGNLKIITDEDAECVYGGNCNFVWENATKMTGLMREHEASWEQGKTYYIKCKDLWDNKGSCFIVKTA